MYLSNRDIAWAIQSGQLVVDPPPTAFGLGYDEVSIDLHLDDIEYAKVWDHAKLAEEQRTSGASQGSPILHLGSFDWSAFAGKYLVPVPPGPPNPDPSSNGGAAVYRKGDEIIVPHGGFLLWTTKEVVGTPEDNPEFIAFVNAKSTKARTGVLVHFTAPTINSGWKGKITLEIANLGPFVFSLKAGDVIAQLTVATISSRPDRALLRKKSITANQIDPSGRAK
jgi:deoxycytidine triphosphate deaminase